MNDFRDHLLNQPTRQEQDEATQLKALRSLVEKMEPISITSLGSIISSSSEVLFGATLSDPCQGWDKVSNHHDISFSFFNCNSLKPHEIVQVLKTLQGPLIKNLAAFSEKDVLEAKLQGFSGYSFPIFEGDIVKTQYGLEFGLDFGLDVILSIDTAEASSKVQYLDCPILKVSSLLSTDEIMQIPNTRTLILDLESPDQAGRFKDLIHPLAILLGHKYLFTKPNNISSGDNNDSKEGSV